MHQNHCCYPNYIIGVISAGHFDHPATEIRRQNPKHFWTSYLFLSIYIYIYTNRGLIFICGAWSTVSYFRSIPALSISIAAYPMIYSHDFSCFKHHLLLKSAFLTLKITWNQHFSWLSHHFLATSTPSLTDSVDPWISLTAPCIWSQTSPTTSPGLWETHMQRYSTYGVYIYIYTYYRIYYIYIYIYRYI